MRFKAQDGLFVLDPDQTVTVTAPTDPDAEWLNVTNAQGGSGSVPAGFLVDIDDDASHDIQPPVKPPDPISGSQSQQSDHPNPSNDLPESIKPSGQPDPAASAAVQKPTPNAPASISICRIPSSSQLSSLPPNRPTEPIISVAQDVPPNSQLPSSASTPTKGPPAPAAKPNALRDRIAMFNKSSPSTPAPSPVVRPKPPIARKPMNIPPPAPPIEASEDPSTSAPCSHQDEVARSTVQSGMSAADAEESVKAGGSLKDRIRLLQQQQQQQAAAAETCSTPPKPKREWKRPPPPPTDEGPLPPVPVNFPSIHGEAAVEDEQSVDRYPELVSNMAPEVETRGTEEEEEVEVNRRRRIAERMAKLGGAKMGFGFPGPAVPPKPAASLTQSSEGSLQTPQEPMAEEVTSLPPERIVMPTIPKRVGPPRRKAPAAAKVATTSEVSLEAVITPAANSLGSTESMIDNSLSQAIQNDESTLRYDPHKLPESNPAGAIESDGNSLHASDVPLVHSSSSSDIDATEPREDVAPNEPPDDSRSLHHDKGHFHSEDDFGSPTPHANVPQNLSEPEAASYPDRFTSASAHEPDQSPSGVTVPNQSLEDFLPTSQVADSPRSSCTGSKNLQTEVESHGLGGVQPVECSSFNFEQSEHNVDTQGGLHVSHAKSNSFNEKAYPEMSHQHEEEGPQLLPSIRSDSPDGQMSMAAVPPYFHSPAAGDISIPLSNSEASSNVEVETRPAIAPSQPYHFMKSYDSGEQGHVENDFAVPLNKKQSLDSQSNSISAERVDHLDEPSTITAAALPAGKNSGSRVACAVNEDDDETARRQRIAERLAKMGGRSMMGGAPSNCPPLESPIVHDALLTEEPISQSADAGENQDQLAIAENLKGLPDEEGEEDDETARRRRIAERMAKMGGRSMMGGMVPLFAPGPSNAASPTRKASTANNVSSPLQPSRALPTPVHPNLPSSNDSSPAMSSAPSPPRRAAPFPNPTDSHENSPPRIPPNRPTISSTPAPEDEVPPSARSSVSMSPHRPRVPTAYHSSPKHSSLLRQPSLPGSVQSMDEQVGGSVEGQANSLGHMPNDPAEFLSKTPPTRSIPSLPNSAAAGATLGISYAGGAPDELLTNNTFEAEQNSGMNLDVEPELSFEKSSKGRSHQSTGSEAGLPADENMGRQKSFKARDLDIASERWWRCRPVQPPSSVTSLDDVFIRLQGTSSLVKGVTISQYELIVIRDDYSKTVVNVKFEDNPDDESSTELTQSHYHPPEPYEVSKLQSLSYTFGPQIVSRAKAKEDEKGFKGIEGSTFVKTIIQSLGNALEPVGSTFGQVIYHCNVIQDSKGSQPEIHVMDDIRPGDVVACYGASFKGKGIGHNSMNLGSLVNPHIGVVYENDIKKNKFKAFGIFNGKVELMSYRLDELRSGSIVVYRVLDKTFID